MKLDEHYKKIQAAIDAATDDGFFVTATTCCCGDGLEITENPGYPYGERREFDLD